MQTEPFLFEVKTAQFYYTDMIGHSGDLICFNDANNRTEFASSALFLRRNGILLRFSPSHEELTVAAAQGNIDVWNIAKALKQST